MEENLNEFEEIEFDEETLKKVARKYILKTIVALFTVVIAVVLFCVSINCIKVNLRIAEQLKWSRLLAQEKRYSLAINKIDIAQRIADENGNGVSVFSIGTKSFWDKLDYYEKMSGPLGCKEMLDQYYPDSKYPAKVKPYLNNAATFSKAYNELRIAVYETAKDYGSAYAEIERIAKENENYPEYLVLYFHLLATQKFDESAVSQLSAYEALEKSAPDAVWLYAEEGTKTLIKNNELNRALRLCPDKADEETNAMHIKIYRMMGAYTEAGMLYDEYRSYDVPSEVLDREMLIVGLLEGNAKKALKSCSYYTKDLDNCKTLKMLYTLWIASIKANDKKLEKKISEYAEKENIPVSQEVQGYKHDELRLTDLFLDGECDLS